MLILIDHNDSFTNNLCSWFQKNSKYPVKKFNCFDLPILMDQHDIRAVIFSPGPGKPQDYKDSILFYQNLASHIPFLGVCLGHQIMLSAHGGHIAPTLKYPMHGRQIRILSAGHSRVLPNYVFNGTFVLYNSLGCLTSDDVFQNEMISLCSEDQMCIAAEHKSLPHIGVQFHPESFASSGGHDFLNAFLQQFQL